ncbi:MAG: START domain-containing protein [Flavisolibacter sp.]
MNKGLFKIAFFLLCSIACSPALLAQNNWKLSKEKDGIRVFESEGVNSSFKRIKVECTLDGSFDKLAEVLSDVDHHKDWIYNNEKAWLLKKVNPGDFYYYSETHMPWPLSDRDAVTHMRINRDTMDRFLDVVETGEPSYIPENSGVVRVPKLYINWHVTMPFKNKLNIVYLMEVEPGGSLPSWIVNMFVDKGPYESFKRLQEILKR